MTSASGAGTDLAVGVDNGSASLLERFRVAWTGEVYVGNGRASATPTTGDLRATAGSGTDVAGAELRLSGGAGTGSGAGGAVGIYTSAAGASGTTTRTLTERLRVDSNGLITGTGTSLGAWTAYTPTLSGTWASGNATASGAYVQIGKTIHYRGSITIGSTTTIGAGLIIISLPVNRASGLGAQTPYGRAVFVDASLGVYNYGVCELDTSSQIIILRAEKVDGTYTELASTSSSVPFTWATNDVIRFFVTYEAA
jgi:hypothetical protein